MGTVAGAVTVPPGSGTVPTRADDLGLPYWSGVLLLRLAAGAAAGFELYGTAARVPCRASRGGRA
jgi:hypothetical protein